MSALAPKEFDRCRCKAWVTWALPLQLTPLSQPEVLGDYLWLALRWRWCCESAVPMTWLLLTPAAEAVHLQ
jgi:hypothetical protein